jgi:hypothetical protein
VELDPPRRVDKKAIVAGRDHCGRTASMVCNQRVDNQSAGFSIESGGRIIGPYDERIAGQRSRHSRENPFTVGQLGREEEGSVGHPELFE